MSNEGAKRKSYDIKAKYKAICTTTSSSNFSRKLWERTEIGVRPIRLWKRMTERILPQLTWEEFSQTFNPVRRLKK